MKSTHPMNLAASLLAVSLLTPVLLTASVATTAATGPIAIEPAATPFKVGNVKVVALHDADLLVANDGSTFGVDATTEEVGKVLAAAGAPTDSIQLSVSALLVETGSHVVLIDTGLGPPVHGVLLQSLAKAGRSAGNITDVLITHAHGDHIGGLLTADGKSAFPKAKIRMSTAEWASLQGQSALSSLAKTIAGQVKTFEPGAVVVPGITAVEIKGHTPGHMAYEIGSGREKILDIGDSAHSSIVSLVKPEWDMGFDGDRVVAKKSRQALLADLAKSHEKIFSPHFPYPGVGTVISVGDHYSWQPVSNPVAH